MLKFHLHKIRRIPNCISPNGAIQIHKLKQMFKGLAFKS